jgi:DNA-binding CsgD family transcriptional regulator
MVMSEWTDSDATKLSALLTWDRDPLLDRLECVLRERHRDRRGGDAIARRQVRVAELTADGFTAAEIVLRLGECSLRTVKSDLAMVRTVSAVELELASTPDLMGSLDVGGLLVSDERGRRRHEGLRLAA